MAEFSFKYIVGVTDHDGRPIDTVDWHVTAQTPELAVSKIHKSFNNMGFCVGSAHILDSDMPPYMINVSANNTTYTGTVG